MFWVLLGSLLMCVFLLIFLLSFMSRGLSLKRIINFLIFFPMWPIALWFFLPFEVDHSILDFFIFFFLLVLLRTGLSVVPDGLCYIPKSQRQSSLAHAKFGLGKVVSMWGGCWRTFISLWKGARKVSVRI